MPTVSHGSAATRLRCDGIINLAIITYLLPILLRKELWNQSAFGEVIDKSMPPAHSGQQHGFLHHSVEEKWTDMHVADADTDRMQHERWTQSATATVLQISNYRLQRCQLDVPATTKLLYQQSISLQMTAAAGPALCSNFLDLSAYRCLRQKILKTIRCTYSFSTGGLYAVQTSDANFS